MIQGENPCSNLEFIGSAGFIQISLSAPEADSFSSELSNKILEYNYIILKLLYNYVTKLQFHGNSSKPYAVLAVTASCLQQLCMLKA